MNRDDLITSGWLIIYFLAVVILISGCGSLHYKADFREGYEPAHILEYDLKLWDGGTPKQFKERIKKQIEVIDYISTQG